MLTAHESILETEKLKLNRFEDASNTLINIGAKIGRLMETTQKAIGDDSDMVKIISKRKTINS